MYAYNKKTMRLYRILDWDDYSFEGDEDWVVLDGHHVMSILYEDLKRKYQ